MRFKSIAMQFLIEFLKNNWQFLLSLLIGSLVTLYAARVYYQKASQELLKESTELRRMNKLILRALEEAELVQLNKSSDGNIRGLKIPVSATLQATGSLRASARKGGDSDEET